MFCISAESVISNIVDISSQEHPQRFKPITNFCHGLRSEEYWHEALGISLDCCLANYEDEKIYEQRTRMFFVFSSNVSVWVATEPEDETFISWTQVPISLWENTSNHDSCWRTDGLRPISIVYFDLAEKINKERKKDGLGEIAPVVMKDHTFINQVKKLKVRFRKNKENQYKKDLMDVKYQS